MEWMPEVKYWMNRQIKTLDEMSKAGKIVGVIFETKRKKNRCV